MDSIYEELLSHIKAVKLQWLLDYDNSVDILFDADTDLGAWPDKRFEFVDPGVEGGPTYYIAYSGDGRAEVHYHSKLINQREDGCWITRKSQGYAGREFPITMQDGRKAILMGPWHGSAPKDTLMQDISYRNINERPEGCYLFGTKFHQDFVKLAMETFHPKLRLIRNKVGKYDFGWTVDKKQAPQHEIDAYMNRQKSDRMKEYALKRLHKLGIQYA